MPSWHSSSNLLMSPKLDTSTREEPPSLRRLRESLSHLEQLERQRHELRDRFEGRSSGSTNVEPERTWLTEGFGSSAIRPASPRWQSASPPSMNLGLGNRAPATVGRSSPSRATAWQPAAKLSKDSKVPLESSGKGGEAAVNNAAANDIRDLITCLEGEISTASQDFSAQVQRIVAEAEQAAHAVGVPRGRESLSLEGEHSIFRACAAWVDQERKRRETLGLPQGIPLPCIDWGEERTQYHATTRSMETKFAQLGKLKRLFEARVSVTKRKSSRG